MKVLVRRKHGNPKGKERSGYFRVACLQNETAPEKCLNRYEKRIEKRENDPKNDLKRDRIIFSPSQAA